MISSESKMKKEKNIPRCKEEQNGPQGPLYY